MVYSQWIHSNMWGKAAVQSLGGSKYFITFLNNYSDEATVMLMKKKSEVLTCHKQYEASVKNQGPMKEIKELQSSWGCKYTSNSLTDHLKAQGMVKRLITHDSLQQNSKAKRLNQTLVEHVGALRLNAKLPKTLWVEAIRHAAYVRNCMTTKNTPNTPHKCATGEKLNLARMPQFKQEVLMLIKAPLKLNAKSKSVHWVTMRKARLIGYIGLKNSQIQSRETWLLCQRSLKRL